MRARNYQVIWSPLAERQLATLWLQRQRHRVRIRATSDDIDRLLGMRPMDIGESREPGERIYHDRPLAVTRDVSMDDRRVVVQSVWWIGSREEQND